MDFQQGFILHWRFFDGTRNMWRKGFSTLALDILSEDSGLNHWLHCRQVSTEHFLKSNNCFVMSDL